MTKLEKLSLARVKALIDGLHSELPSRMPFFIDEKPSIEDFKSRVSDEDKKSRVLWTEDHTAKREAIQILEAVMEDEK